MQRVRSSLFGLALAALATLPAFAQAPRAITVASTTSTEQSGLFGHLLPRFTEKTGIDVKVVALGTGQALDVGRRGDADVVFVHDKAAEEKFVAEGFATKRQEVMYNDFVIVGPKADPAKATGQDVLEACAASPPPRLPSSRAATAPARMRRSCATGRTPASISPPSRATGTRRSARAWGPPSTPPRPRTPMC